MHFSNHFDILVGDKIFLYIISKSIEEDKY